jgi:hypothetical protein
MGRMHQIAAVAVGLSAMSVTVGGDTPREAFARAWVGRTVVVKQPLYTLLYDERGMMGQTRRDKRDGLNVVTPFKGSFLQFDGRQGQDDVTDLDPQRLVDRVKGMYQPNNLDLRAYRKVQPHLLFRYDPGAELLVGDARVERDFVRVLLVDPKTDFGEEPATSLTVRWSVPFSRSFTERDAVEGLMLQYLQMRPAPR